MDEDVVGEESLGWSVHVVFSGPLCVHRCDSLRGVRDQEVPRILLLDGVCPRLEYHSLLD
jgi:hypothetical protein